MHSYVVLQAANNVVLHPARDQPEKEFMGYLSDDAKVMEPEGATIS